MLNHLLIRQLSYDFSVSEADIIDKNNHFSIVSPHPKSRVFEKGKKCFLNIATVNGKLLATGETDIIQWFKEQYQDANGEWFMEVENFRSLEKKLADYNYQLGQAHLFYTADQITEVDTQGYTIRKFVGEDIHQFKDDARFDEAFIFAERPKDEIGFAAYKGDQILGMAGATSDSDSMWQIGINVIPEAEGLGIGSMLVTLIKNEILALGKLPFYGTSLSHIASHRLAIKAGFLPTWTQLYCDKRPSIQ